MTKLAFSEMSRKTGAIVVAIFAPFPVSFFERGGTGRGGGQGATWLPQLAEAWRDSAEVEIHWCVLDRSVRRRTIGKYWNQTFHSIPDRGLSIGLLTARLFQRFRFREVLREVRPDIIHCFGTETLNGAALWEFDGPGILSMQGVVTSYYKTGDLRSWHWKFLKYWEPRTIGKAAVVTCESRWGGERVGEVVPGKAHLRIEYGVFSSFYEVDWKPDLEHPAILFVGALNRLKGVDILVEMLRRHRERRWKMVFVGGGYLEEKLRNLDDPGVEVLGTLKTVEVQQQMAKAWGIVLPSRADTSPNVIKEARVIGLPIVVSPHGGHAEYLRSGVDGILVETEDPDDWFAALNMLCGDFERCQAMGAARHAMFREHFRPEKTARAFLDLYRELAR